MALCEALIFSAFLTISNDIKQSFRVMMQTLKIVVRSWSYHHYHKYSQPISLVAIIHRTTRLIFHSTICVGTIRSEIYEGLKQADNAMDQVDALSFLGGRRLPDIFNKVPS